MVLREWGSCGRVAVVDGEVVGHLIWAPPVHVPAADGFADRADQHRRRDPDDRPTSTPSTVAAGWAG